MTVEPREACAVVLLAAGTGVLLLSGAALLALPRPHARLHALTPASSLGAPLCALALAVAAGPGREAGKLLVVAALMVLGGTLATLAVGRSTAVDEGRVPRDSPP
ncbi:monovalent cation/H(+) antiporter subunit G [Streptomyces sp. NPDC000075]|uniref:monovalent cation/H(+) antiporter subunit G n=1 Tax=Streptomyces TaxID=1883 RepID=UPI0031DCEA07